MQIKVLPGQSILDAAIASAGSAEDAFALARLNGLSLTDYVPAGTQLQATGLSYAASSTANNDHITVLAVPVLPRQTLLDLAVQQLGSMEAVFALYRLNGISLTTDLATGEYLNYSITPYSKKVAKTYADNGYKPACGISVPLQPSPPIGPQGIGYWYIEKDFIVQ